MAIPDKWRKVFQEEQELYEASAWRATGCACLCGLTDIDTEKIEAYCQMAEERVKDGVIFDRNKIVEILPWD
jgi:hypothetical protein